MSNNNLTCPVNFDSNGLAKLGIDPNSCCRSLRPTYDSGPYWDCQPVGLACDRLFIASLMLKKD